MAIKTSSKHKIDFGRKIETVKTSNLSPSVEQSTEQMRLVIDEGGAIVYANDTFANLLNLPAQALVNRQLLDTVFFEDVTAFMNDRALFNNISQGVSFNLKNLKAGDYILLIGPEQKAWEFRFDWITMPNKKHYLVAGSHTSNAINASSRKNGGKADWSFLIETVLDDLNSEPDFKALDNQQKIVSCDEKNVKKTHEHASATKKSYTDTPVSKKTNAKDLKEFAQLHRDLLCIIREDGYICRTNDHFSQKIQMPAKQAVRFVDLIHSDDRSAVLHFINSLLEIADDDVQHGKPLSMEARILCNESISIWTKWTFQRKNELIYALGYDITANKISDQALVRRELELSEAQALANMGHWRWRVGNSSIEWSEQIYKMFDVPSDDFQPTLDNVGQFFHKRDFGRMMQAFQRAIIEQNNYDMDFRIVRPDESIRYIRCEGRCELDSEGDVLALYGIMQDVTDQTMHEMDLREAKEAAEQAYAAKSRFLANMSHELRTPLNAIIGFSDMIERQMLGPLGSEKYVDYAGSIKDSGEHLLDLITDILDMSKIEAGKYTLDLEKIQLGNVIHTASRMIESRAQEGLLTLENTVQGDDPVVIADRRAIMQILLNILSNAVKFTEPGGMIKIACETFDNHVAIKISDTGIGIPANKLNAVMRPFEQVSTALTRNHEGSGLGLAITKELAELHGGMLNLESSVGQGTTAILRLPFDASKKQRIRT